jgi:hypothetical protein
MKLNMGSADRIIRAIIAITLGVLYYYNVGFMTGTLGIVLLVVAAVFLLTSMVSFCPIYVAIGLSTKSKSS